VTEENGKTGGFMAAIIFRIITSTGWVGYLERMAKTNRTEATSDVYG
jgi:hypothetical protein